MDLVNWLEKKLSDAGVWSGRMTASILSREMLEELETCFQAIDAQTKLKIISCIPHMNPRKLSMVHAALLALLDLASKDADDWVETIADMYRDVPSTGVIIPVFTNKDSHFAKTIEDLTKCLQRHLENGELKLAPEGYSIVSNSVNKASFGPPPETEKCFVLRKKPKSFNLMNDMIKQCSRLVDANREKNSGLWSASVPIKIRSTLRTGNNDLPMKGIPNQNPCKLSSGFTYEKKFQRQLSKREGGAKLLDICELPQSLKKRRQMEMVEERKRKQEEKEMAKRKALEDRKEREAKKAAQDKIHENAKRQFEKKSRTDIARVTEAGGFYEQINDPYIYKAEEGSSSETSLAPSRHNEKVFTQQQGTEQQLEMRHSAEDPHLSRERIQRLTQRVHNDHQQQQQLQQQQQQQQQRQHFAEHLVRQPSTLHRLPTYSGAVVVATHVREQRTPVQRAREAAIMNQCNEMLRNANSLDQNGRQLVIAFMTGNKCNPRPELGHIITMKLSETIEDGLADNQICKMKVETFFQMDYQSGEWKRLRKCRLLQPHELENNSEQYMYISNEDYHNQVQQQPT